MVTMNSIAAGEHLGLQSVLSDSKPSYSTIGSLRNPATARFNLIRTAQQLTQCALILLVAVAAYFVITLNFIQSVEVVGVSMVPTLSEHAHYLLNRWAFHDREPQRLDVVVITDPGDHGASVKRIIGLPGEMIHIKNGKVSVNSKELKEPYLLPNTHTFTYSTAKEQLIACGKNRFYVLGDNRTMSIDSRFYGSVPRQNIRGLIVMK
ncbi:MAG: signal peptidase signal peptidase [Pedosphaera sp.]|nr:signal peptidase signal peptidase [Pedosphaera sp.]